ncbi:flagellar protein FlgN [Proteiniborus ethanoligenes]|nr:flagellar protein FlgN [Proteiniborus ethanoligenes]
MEHYRAGDDNMAENTIYDMVSIIEEKLELLKHILDVKPKQKEAIEKEDIDAIESSLSTIQKQISAIDQLDSIYADKLKELKDRVGVESIEELDHTKFPNTIALRDRIKEIRSVLEAIKIIDDENIALMNDKFQETKKKLKNLRKGQKVVKGYSSDHDETMFINERN